MKLKAQSKIWKNCDQGWWTMVNMPACFKLYSANLLAMGDGWEQFTFIILFVRLHSTNWSRTFHKIFYCPYNQYKLIQYEKVRVIKWLHHNESLLLQDSFIRLNDDVIMKFSKMTLVLEMFKGFSFLFAKSFIQKTFLSFIRSVAKFTWLSNFSIRN